MRRSVLVAVALVGAVVTIAPPTEGSHGHVVPRDLRICVDSYATSADFAAIRPRLERLMRERVERHPNFGAAGYRQSRWFIEDGCPSQPALLLSGEKHPKNGGAPGLAGFTSVSSGVRAFVFLVPQVEIERMFGSLTYTTAFQEITCTSEDSCGEESTAFYVSPETFSNSDQKAADATLAKGLLETVGLELPFPLPAPRKPNTPASK